MQRLQKYSTEKLATAATEGAQMEIDSKTTADRCHLQDHIKKQISEITKIFFCNLIALKTLLTQ